MRPLPVKFQGQFLFKLSQLLAVNCCWVRLQEIVCLLCYHSVHLEEVGALHRVLGRPKAAVEVLNNDFANVVALLILLVFVLAEQKGAAVGATEF